ncbi:hypothetical protein FOXB_01620, partial [Fusarium oxysporum f. sp. conglutinans Fo5176]
NPVSMVLEIPVEIRFQLEGQALHCYAWFTPNPLPCGVMVRCDRYIHPPVYSFFLYVSQTTI